MKHGSLFSGIGGFDLAAQWMGWENVFHCEWNDFGKQVLNYYWPNAIAYENIKETDFTIHRGQIDLLTGGFPCQPYSAAGKRKGTADERHLWPEMLRAIREIQPRWIVGENVLGIINWNGGLVFEEVQSDLEAEGYEVQAYVLPACGVKNAPHQRYRTWFVAHSNGANEGASNGGTNTEKEGDIRGRTQGNVSATLRFDGTTSNTTGEQSERLQSEQYKHGQSQQGEFRRSSRQMGDGIVTDPDPGVRGGGRTERPGGTDGKREFHSTKEEQTRHDLRGEVERCDSISTQEGIPSDPNGLGCDTNHRSQGNHMEGHEPTGTHQTGNRGVSEANGLNDERSIANSNGIGNSQQGQGSEGEGGAGEFEKPKRGGQHSEQSNELHGLSQSATDPNGTSCERGNGQTQEGWKGPWIGIESLSQPNEWEEFPTQPPICSGDDGLSTYLDDITFSKWRNESIKAYGNAVVPQLVLQIFKAIEQYESLKHE